MSDQEFQNTVEAMASLRDELTSSPERARAYLIEAGILLPNGEVAEQRQPQNA
jgi:hypothetical protein